MKAETPQVPYELAVYFVALCRVFFKSRDQRKSIKKALTAPNVQ